MNGHRLAKQVKHVHPHAILVGYSGKMGWDDRLLPLRMTRKYINFLKQEESERNEKILQMSQLIQKYENLSSVIRNLKEGNINNENSALLLELDQDKESYRKRLLHLKSKLDRIPDNLNRSMQDVFKKTARWKSPNMKNNSFLKRKKNTPQAKHCGYQKHVINKQKNKQSCFNLPAKHGLPTNCAGKTVDAARPSSNSLFGSVESQVQVRYGTSPTLRTVSVDLFSSGENFLSILHRQFEGEINSYSVFLGSKKMCKVKSLWEQGVIHGCILDLKIRKNSHEKSGKIHQKEQNRAMGVQEKENLATREELEDDGSEDEDPCAKSSYFGSFKSQLLIKDCYSRVKTINIDLFSNGRNLERVLRSEFGEEFNNYRVLFGSKQVDKKKSLYSQGMTHGATLELSVGLDGGMKSQEDQLDSKASGCKGSDTTGSPETWKKVQVGQWINRVCEEYEIDKSDVSKLQTLNGKGLNKLSEKDWKERSPQGDLFYKIWIDLKSEKSSEEADTREPKTLELQSVVSTHSEMLRDLHVPTRQKICRSLNVPKSLGGDYKTLAGLIGMSNNDICIIETKLNPAEELLLWWDPYSSATVHKFRELLLHEVMRREDLVDILDKRSLPTVPALEESKFAVIVPEERPPPLSPMSDSSASESGNIEIKANERSIKGLFQKLDSFYELSESISLDQLDNNEDLANPAEGNVVCITGICFEKLSSKDRRTIVLRGDPKDASSVLNELTVDIHGKKTKERPNAKAMKKLLNKIDVGIHHVAVLGRVEKLDPDYIPKKGFEALKFKLVVDSYYHGLVYTESKVVPLQRQQSQPSYNHIYPAKVDEKSLDVGDSITKTNKRVFCKATAFTDDKVKRDEEKKEIKKLAVAFKNSFDGDIFIGVEANGTVSGKEGTKGQLTHWMEEIGKTIGNILPGTADVVSFCESDDEAGGKIGKECFLSVMKLGDCQNCQSNVEMVKVIARIHVPKGSAPVYFSTEKDSNAFVRVGAETKGISDSGELFSRLESLSSCKVKPITDKELYIKEQVDKTFNEKAELRQYKVFKTLKPESHSREFKMIFSNSPVRKIVEEYVAEYCCGFLNSNPGSIYCGVQEDEESKEGHVIGLVIPSEERKELAKRSFAVLSDFYPPVNSGQVSMKFSTVFVPFDFVLKYLETHGDRSGKCVILRGSPEIISRKWAKFIKVKMPEIFCRVIRVETDSFCIVAKDHESKAAKIVEIVEEFQKTNKSGVSLSEMHANDLKHVLQDLCLVEFDVPDRSQYPIHMTKPLKTHYFNDQGELLQLEPEKLVSRFKVEKRYVFDVQKFLGDVDNFDPSGNSYIMISSPFNLPLFERDLYGLVIPKWTLAIDFDQDPKEKGHFFQIFVELHDRYQKERDRFLVTPEKDSLDLNADHGICWLAARGHREIATSLSHEKLGEPNWNTSHRRKISSLLSRELVRNVKPNKLHVVVLWDEGHCNLIYSLNLLLADILSINENTAISFVCSTPAAHSDISEGPIKELKNNYGNISKNDYVCPLHVLAKFLACNLPEIFRPEDEYQVPHKAYAKNGSSPVIFPATLPQRLRQNIKGRLKIMYMNNSGKPDAKSLDEERRKFYSGSQITLLGLRGKIGIEREKIADLAESFKTLCNDKKSRVSLIVVKADRGAGTTTMCLQFLFRNHERFPCAQLVEIHRDLLGSVEKINQITNLPILLLVDEEVANLQDFLDFKKEAEVRRNVNIIFLLVEPAFHLAGKKAYKKPLASSAKGKKSQIRNFGDSSLYGTSSYEEIELGKELQPKEFKELTEELMEICCSMKDKQEKQEKLTNVLDRAKYENGRMLRSFAHFSLTVFGKDFSGLEDYVRFRLELASEQQKDILAFLSLTHVFTDYALPAGALARLLKKDSVVMKAEFQDFDLRELLSPPDHENDLRRISFLDVAEEILKQLAETTIVKTADEDDESENKYWSFIKYVSVKMAREVLSVNIGASKIDRLTRKLFVISEFESEKFSFLIRKMKSENPDIARDTLLELVEVFQGHDSIKLKAHLLAHLAKYYMIEYKDFKEAKPRIEEAVENVPEDSLLHHIQGDIIRYHVEALKNEKQVEMNDIVSYAIKSSQCFEIVRTKRPRMGHGFASDATVRIIVMQAAIKAMGGGPEMSFVDYLIQMLEEWVAKESQLTYDKQYILALITDAYEYLNESSIDFEYKERLMEKYMNCILKVSELNRFCEKLKEVKKSFPRRQAWIEEVIIQTHSLLCVLEIELTKDMTAEEFAIRIKKIEECGSRSKLDERSMKYWFRYARFLCPPPTLDKVNKRVKQWIDPTRRRGGISPHAEFYNYVVSILTALQDPRDREKMEIAANLVKRQQHHKSSRKEVSKFTHIEWLRPKEFRHINSIDSLLHNDDLLKEEKTPSYQSHRPRPGREIIERCLRGKNVARWEGVVKHIKSDWHGTISFQSYIDVHFIPQHVPHRPALGDTVHFYLAFDWNGPSAWSVNRSTDSNVRKSPRYNYNEGSSSSSSEELETDRHISVPRPLHSVCITEQEDHNDWEHHVGRRMTGVVVNMTNKGYGYLSHPGLLSNLWFNMNQFSSDPPCEEVITKYMVLEFTVETISDGKFFAENIRVIKDTCVEKEMQDYVAHLKNSKSQWGNRDLGSERALKPQRGKRGSGRERARKPQRGNRDSGSERALKPQRGKRDSGSERALRPSWENRDSGSERIQKPQLEHHDGAGEKSHKPQLENHDPAGSAIILRPQWGNCDWSSERSISNQKWKDYAEQPFSLPSERREQNSSDIKTGEVWKFFPDLGYGFIKSLGISTGIYFHRYDFVSDRNPQLGDLVEFHLTLNEKGYVAKNVICKLTSSWNMRDPAVVDYWYDLSD